MGMVGTAPNVAGAARRAAAALSRRASLLALGGGALAAVAGAAPTLAGKEGKSARKQARRKCRRQGGQCRASLLAICADVDIDCDPFLPCCQHFERCDAAAAVTCIFGEDDDTARRAGLVRSISVRP